LVEKKKEYAEKFLDLYRSILAIYEGVKK